MRRIITSEFISADGYLAGKEGDMGWVTPLQRGDGWGTLLTRIGLIDEYQLLVHPVFLGRGKSLFAQMEHCLDLKLVQACAWGIRGEVMQGE